MEIVDFVWEKDADGIYDLVITDDGDIKTEASYDTAILYSILGERRANSAEVPVAQLRRGWWGNELRSDGFENGSKVWLAEQSRLTTEVLNQLTANIETALSWLIDDNFADQINVAVVRVGQNSAQATIEIIVGNSIVDTQTLVLWENTGEAQ